MRLHEVHRIEDMKSMPGAMHPGDVITSKTTRLGARGSGPAAALPQQVFTARGDRHDDTGSAVLRSKSKRAGARQRSHLLQMT
jgi:hypothetical protein